MAFKNMAFKKEMRVPHQLLVLLVLAGFGAWVLAPLVIAPMAANAGVSHATLAAVLRLTVTVLGVAFALVVLRIAFSPVHEARGDQPPSRIVAASFKPAPWRRARLASNRELMRAWSNRVLRREDSFNTVRTELNRVYQTNPELALQLYREWATSRGVSTVPVVTKYGVAGRWIKAAWSEAFASRKLHWLHLLSLEAKTGLVRITNPIVAPPTVLGTRIAFIARPWGGARMNRLRHRENPPRGAFVLDLAPILVLAAITALSTGATIALANL